MTEKLLPSDIDFDGPFPRLSRRLRLGVVGGGRIAATQAMAARLSDRWDVVAGALSSDPEKSRQRAAEYYLDPTRAYASFAEMAVPHFQKGFLPGPEQVCGRHDQAHGFGVGDGIAASRKPRRPRLGCSGRCRRRAR